MAVQLDLALEFSTEQEDEPMRLGRSASFSAGLRVGLFFLLLAAVNSL